ncbi:MAG: hypothetical protein ACRDT4_02285 [Micromonosporaceae bacterium]
MPSRYAAPFVPSGTYFSASDTVGTKLALAPSGGLELALRDGVDDLAFHTHVIARAVHA